MRFACGNRATTGHNMLYVLVVAPPSAAANDRTLLGENVAYTRVAPRDLDRVRRQEIRGDQICLPKRRDLMRGE